ncbi:MAG: translation elongation factor Ts [Planctomycetota bacterium]|jgi:elongation factor Ts
MAIDAKTVAELRRRTGLPMMKCKEALVAAEGDLDKAQVNLRKEGHKTIDRLKDREMKEGLVFTHAGDAGVAAVAVLCETDFVARAKDFVAFGEQLARDLYERAPADRGDGESITDVAMYDGRSVKEHLDELVGSKIRENMKVGEYACLKPDRGYVACYVHHNRKVASLVELLGEDLATHDAIRALGQDLGMQIAFHAQLQALDREGLDAEWVEKEREIFLAQVQNMPEGKRDQIAAGKLAKRLKDVLLLDQPFIKNEKESVKQRIAAVAKETDVPVTIRRFARISAGA